MEAFSGLLHSLYRQAKTIIPPAEFQVRTLNAVRDVLAFDSALWATGAMISGVPTVHTVYVYCQPPDMMENWERIKQQDKVVVEAFNSLGRTINAALTTDAYWQKHLHPDAIAHIKRYGMEHVLATIIADPVLRLFTAVSFYRANPEQPFTETERLFKQNLMLHLDETLNTNRFNFISSHNSGTPTVHVRAICDKRGVLHSASQNFDCLMLAEWPDWRGPELPLALLDTLSGKEPHQYTGNDIIATIKGLNDLFLICARKKSVVDELSPRELVVARLYGQGKDFRAIAAELYIAPTTVRCHLQTIYTKLGVSNKVEMAHMIPEEAD